MRFQFFPVGQIDDTALNVIDRSTTNCLWRSKSLRDFPKRFFSKVKNADEERGFAVGFGVMPFKGAVPLWTCLY